MLIAEELVLLGLDPVRGTPVHKPRQALLLGAAGALVAELERAGAVDLSGRGIVVTGPPPDQPLLDLVHGWLAEHHWGRRSAAQLYRLQTNLDLWGLLVDGLIDSGLLGRRRDTVLFVTVTRHPLLQPAVRDQLLERLRADLRARLPRAVPAGEGVNVTVPPKLPWRTATLVALAHECSLTPVVLPDPSERRLLRREVAAAGAATPVAAAVKKAIAMAESSGD